MAEGDRATDSKYLASLVQGAWLRNSANFSAWNEYRASGCNIVEAAAGAGLVSEVGAAAVDEDMVKKKEQPGEAIKQYCKEQGKYSVPGTTGTGAVVTYDSTSSFQSR